MAPETLSLRSYGHHHHHLLPQQQTDNGSLPSALTESYQPRQSETSNLQNSNSGGPCMTPTWRGFVHTTYDALTILEACLLGKLNHIPRRPHDRERPHIIVSGNVFIYEENASGIKRWTDGVTWSPSRIMGNFLVYRELSEPFPAGEKKKAKKRKRGSEEVEPTAHLSAHSEEDRKLVGSLVDSYGFKPDGLIKKTLNVKYKGVNHHIVSYYNLEDVKRGSYTRPGFDRVLADIHPREELMTHHFKFNAVDAEDDLTAAAIDPYHGQPVMPIQNSSMYNQSPPLHVYPSEQALAPTHEVAFAHMNNPAMSQSPHATISAGCTPADYYQFTYSQPASQYLGPDMVDGLSHGHSRGDNRVDSVIGSHQPHFKSELSDMQEMPAFSSTSSDTASVAALSHSQPLTPSADPFAVHSAGPIYEHIDGSAHWSLAASTYHEPLSMPQTKRRQTAPIMTFNQLSPALARTLMNYNQHLHHFSPLLPSGGGGNFSA